MISRKIYNEPKLHGVSYTDEHNNVLSLFIDDSANELLLISNSYFWSIGENGIEYAKSRINEIVQVDVFESEV